MSVFSYAAMSGIIYSFFLGIFQTLAAVVTFFDFVDASECGFLYSFLASEGFELDGFELDGFEPEGFEPEGFEPEGCEPEGFEPEGFAPEGFAPEGFEPEGFEPEGLELEGLELEGFEPVGLVLKVLLLNGRAFEVLIGEGLLRVNFFSV